MNGLFITGTGTGVGKTFVACALARGALAAGRRVLAFKPIETGCRRIGGALVGDDQELLVAAAGGWQTGDERGLYCFERPVAPLVASRETRQPINVDQVARVLADASRTCDFALVEGAGGWRVPITEDADMAQLARRLGLPVVVVGTAGLGTINHTLLTLEAVERDGCSVAAVVLSARPSDPAETSSSNANEIRRRWPGRVEVLSTDVLVLD